MKLFLYIAALGAFAVCFMVSLTFDSPPLLILAGAWLSGAGLLRHPELRVRSIGQVAGGCIFMLLGAACCLVASC
jgi:hypothetical protein